jgi:hypothetical protein
MTQIERKVDFVACDMPIANAFMINVYAAVAQEERRVVANRQGTSLSDAVGAPDRTVPSGRCGRFVLAAHCSTVVGAAWPNGHYRDLRRSRRAGGGALIQGCRVHEWSWECAVGFYGARVPWPVVGGADVVVLLACVTILLTS